MKTFLQILKNYKYAPKLVLFVLVSWIITEVIYASFPQIIRQLMNVIEKHLDSQLLFFRWSIGVSLVLVSAILWYLNEIFHHKFGEKFTKINTNFISKNFLKNHMTRLSKLEAENLLQNL